MNDIPDNIPNGFMEAMFAEDILYSKKYVNMRIQDVLKTSLEIVCKVVNDSDSESPTNLKR